MPTYLRFTSCLAAALAATLALCGLSNLSAAENAVKTSPGALDPNLPFYRPVEKLNGELKLGGSNTLSHVASA